MSKIDEARKILNALGVPTKQQSDLSCYALLAMAGIKESGKWNTATNEWIRIHDIIVFTRNYYGVTYAENSRETIRKQVVHYFQNVAFIEDNGRAHNSPNYRYRLTDEMLSLICSYGGKNWENELSSFLANHKTLVNLYSTTRSFNNESVKINGWEFTDITFAESVKKTTAKEFKTVELSEQEYYSHPTFIINNLADYIRLIAKISSINKASLYSESVIYRGMADKEYDLLPGLARSKELAPDLEGTLINDFLTRRPDSFNGLSEFDTLAKMQHYGLPTRLLDFSLNPLVALYFACESGYTKSGRILCHYTELQNDSSLFVNAICKAAIKKMFDENYTVDEYLCDESLTLRKYMMEAYNLDITTVVRPKYWNQRIANQAGVFMVFPNNLLDRYMGILIYAKELGLETAIKEFGKGRIEKEKIQEALQREPVDSYRSKKDWIVTDEFFKELLKVYNEESEDTFWDSIKNRFRMTCEIKPLSKDKISDRFCSIIIEAGSKRKILKDLSYIGIGADYIYPELEYTAREIKRRFE